MWYLYRKSCPADKGERVSMRINNIPEEFIKYFWEYDVNKINLSKNHDLIIERILNYGNIESIKWLFSIYKIEIIKEILSDNKRLLPKTKNYWKLILMMPGKKLCPR